MESNLKRMRKITRERMLEEHRQFGRPRAKSWGGKDDAKTDRRKVKQRLHECH